MAGQERFEQACRAYRAAAGGRTIGVLGERTLHGVLKHYYEPYADSHEIRIGGFVADIVGEEGIIEIQTRGFDKLRRKLAAFLEVSRVTVVYPVAAQKWIVWIEPDTGEVVSRRKSPRRGSYWDAVGELYKIRPLLPHPNLQIRLVLLELEEHRLLTGRSRDKKRWGAVRCERLPLKLEAQVDLSTPQSYLDLVPRELEPPFDSKQFAKAARLRMPDARTALNILHYVGALERVGKEGNAYLYGPAQGLLQGGA